MKFNVCSVFSLMLLLSQLASSLPLLMLEHAEDQFLIYFFLYFFFFNINKTILQLLDSELKLQSSIQNTNQTLNDKVIFSSSTFFYYTVQTQRCEGPQSKILPGYIGSVRQLMEPAIY